jgi:hypothetical protein
VFARSRAHVDSRRTVLVLVFLELLVGVPFAFPVLLRARLIAPALFLLGLLAGAGMLLALVVHPAHTGCVDRRNAWPDRFDAVHLASPCL